jgi:Holliday junction resolvasome RuvABC endonuclease subunit
MTTLGIDPGSRYSGWCLLSAGGDLIDCGQVCAAPNTPWARRLPEIVRVFRHIIAETEPGIVGIERTEVNQGMLGDLAANPGLIGRVRAQARATQQTSQLIAELAALAAAQSARVVLVHPATGLARLTLKRGCSDRQISAAFVARFGGRLLVREHHIARAAGVALAARVVARTQAEELL